MTARRAAKYKRISDDREGRELGINRQDEDLDALASRLGVTIVADYTDNDISASTRSRKNRPRYDAMIADAKAGAFDVILAYTSGRLTRRVREHLDLVDLATDHGIKFQYVQSPSFDLNTSAGRRIASTLAVQDQAEVEDIAERTQRDVLRRAQSGAFHGGAPPFGYRATTDVIKNKVRVVAIDPHPVHADWVREAMRRLLAGESLHAVCVDWNRKGRPTGSTATHWYAKTLKRIVTTPAVVGERHYRGQVYPAPWPAIITNRDDWVRLCTILTDPGRRQSNSNHRKYELSGLVWCGLCDTRMGASTVAGLSFKCAPGSLRGGCGRMRIMMKVLEPYIEEQVFASIDDRALAAAAQDTDQPNDEARTIQAAITADEQALVALEDEYDDGHLPRDRYARRRDRITTRLDANRRALAGVVRPSVTLPSADVLRASWPGMTHLERRTILEQVIDRIYIHPHPTGVTTAPPRRASETDDQHRHRVEVHTAKVLAQRVDVRWLV